MALLINGSEPDNVRVGGVDAQTVRVNGTVVWEAYSGPPSPVIITSSGDYVAGTDFPANTDITIQVLGGGGAGGYAEFTNGGAGGQASDLVTATQSISSGTTVSAVVGGGAGNSDFNGVVATGGANGANGGCGYGNGCNGEDSAWGSGGSGGVGFTPATGGGVGAGGGGSAGGTLTNPGSGGRGEIRLSW